MRRLYLSPYLIAGVVAALVLGGTAAVLIASQEERTNDAPIKVPVGRVGDRVVYAYFVGGPDAESDWTAYGSASIGAEVLAQDGDAAPRFGELTPAGPRVFEVDSAVRARDAAHYLHDAVVVIYNLTLGAAGGGSLERVEHVDLSERVVFRTDINAVFGPEGVKGAPTASGSVQSSSFLIQETALPGLSYQGLELRLGQVLRDRTLPPPAGISASVGEVHERIWVDARARIDDVDAYAVRHEVTYQAILPPNAFTDSDAPSEESPSGAPTSEQVLVTAWRVDWMSAGSPYAVLRESGIHYRDGEKDQELESHRAAYKLDRVEPGNAFIAWASHDAPHWATQRSDLERNAGAQLHPEDGSDPGLRYKLSDAVASVASSPPLGFVIFQISNPNPVLVGAQYGERRDATGLLVAEWRLLYANPTSGAAHEVWSRKALNPDGAPANQDSNRPWSVGVFRTSDLPQHPPTITGLRRTWEDYVSGDARSQTFNFVRWGVDLSDGDPCKSGAGFQLDASDLQLLAYLEGGHSAGGDCPAEDAEAVRSSSVTVDVASGLTTSAFESEPLLGLGSQEPFQENYKHGWKRAASTIPAGVQPPDPAETATASVSVLAVFLAVYFWPTLKFLGASGFMTGYAKIAKEDLLNNPVRDAILALIRTTPGIHASDIARQANAGWGTIVYHLSVLERNKIITSLVDGRHKRFFPADTVDYSKRGQLAALMNQNTRTIYDLIENQPGIVQGDLAGRMGLTIPTVIWHLQRLEEAGLVGRDREGRRFHYFANPVYQPKKPETGESMEVQ